MNLPMWYAYLLLIVSVVCEFIGDRLKGAFANFIDTYHIVGNASRPLERSLSASSIIPNNLFVRNIVSVTSCAVRHLSQTCDRGLLNQQLTPQLLADRHLRGLCEVIKLNY